MPCLEPTAHVGLSCLDAAECASAYWKSAAPSTIQSSPVPSALFINARGAYELFVGRPYADRQRAEYYRHRLSGTPLEKTLRDANLFGKTAHAKFVTCEYDYTEQWDYVCFIDNYQIANNAPIDPGRVFKGTKFGVMVDDTHVARMSALYPADGPDPPLK